MFNPQEFFYGAPRGSRRRGHFSRREQFYQEEAEYRAYRESRESRESREIRAFSRIPPIDDLPIFYPGSYIDTKPIKGFQGRKYIYCDVNPDVLALFELKGFDEIHRQDLHHRDVFQGEYQNNYAQVGENVERWVRGIQESWQKTEVPICQYRVYERRCRKIEILFIIHDANMVFDWLYFQERSYPLFGFVSANYYGPSFCEGSPTFELMDHFSQYPKWEIALYSSAGDFESYKRLWERCHLRMQAGSSLLSLMSYLYFKRSICAQMKGIPSRTALYDMGVRWYQVSSMKEVDIREVFLEVLRFNLEICQYFQRFLQEYIEVKPEFTADILTQALIQKYGELDRCRRELGEEKFLLLSEMIGVSLVT